MRLNGCDVTLGCGNFWIVLKREVLSFVERDCRRVRINSALRGKERGQVVEPVVTTGGLRRRGRYRHER